MVVVSPVLHDHTDGIQSQFVSERLVWVSLLKVFPQLGRFCQTLLPFSVLLGLKLRIENKEYYVISKLSWGEELRDDLPCRFQPKL